MIRLNQFAVQIKSVEEEMAKTQKNKATSYHLGQLKAKLAKLKRELLTPSSSGGGGGCKSIQSMPVDSPDTPQLALMLLEQALLASDS